MAVLCPGKGVCGGGGGGEFWLCLTTVIADSVSRGGLWRDHSHRRLCASMGGLQRARCLHLSECFFILLVVLVKKETIYSEARFIILCLPFVPLAALAFCQDFSVLVILFPDTSVFALCPQPCCCVVLLIQWHGLPISLSQLVSHRFFIFICIYLLFSHYIQLIVATDFIYLLYMSKHNK